MATAAGIVHGLGHADITLPPLAYAIDWQPRLARSEPWRAWTAAFLHLSDQHLMANLAGSAVVAAWGAFARVPARCVVAWLIAWPLVQFGLSLQPELRHFGGLSGVLHAGVTIVTVHLVCSGSRTQRRVATAVLVGTIVKLLSESPWSGAISHQPGWDIPVAPGAHVSGVLAGAIVTALTEGIARAAASLREARNAIDAHD
jgi:rhomboid family GlyGly-CTERM serine protease